MRGIISVATPADNTDDSLLVSRIRLLVATDWGNTMMMTMACGLDACEREKLRQCVIYLVRFIPSYLCVNARRLDQIFSNPLLFIMILCLAVHCP